MTMTRHTHIDELSTLGHELTEHHLTLAAGGLPIVVPKPRTVEQYVTTGGPRLFDERFDW